MEPSLSRHEQIEKTLASIDGIGRAEAPPFFYTRLQAQLDKKTAPTHPFWTMVTRPAVSLVTLSILVSLNIAAIRSYTLASKKTAGTQQPATSLQTFAEAYNLDGSSVFSDKTTDQ